MRYRHLERISAWLAPIRLMPFTGWDSMHISCCTEVIAEVWTSELPNCYPRFFSLAPMNSFATSLKLISERYLWGGGTPFHRWTFSYSGDSSISSLTNLSHFTILIYWIIKIDQSVNLAKTCQPGLFSTFLFNEYKMSSWGISFICKHLPNQKWT